MKLLVCDSLDDLSKHALQCVYDACDAHDGTVRIALSGGSTPWPFYQTLSSCEDIPFERIEFYQVDERYVPGDHEHSNRRMMEEALIRPLISKVKGFYFFDTSLEIDECVADYEAALSEFSGKFDLVFLGIGPDGHTASLFPHSPALTENEWLAAHTKTTEFDVKDRLTITFPSIMASNHLVALLKGTSKQPLITELQQGSLSVQEFPSKKLVDHPHFSVLFAPE